MSIKGNRNYDSCQVKQVEITDLGKAHPAIVRALGGRSIVPESEYNTMWYVGSTAQLHCPLTENPNIKIESEGDYQTSKKGANKSLRKTAGELVCKSCPYAGMSLLEVAASRTKESRLELERVENAKARALAVSELAEIDPSYKHI